VIDSATGLTLVNTAFRVVGVFMLRATVIVFCSMFPVQPLNIAQYPCPIVFTVDMVAVVGWLWGIHCCNEVVGVRLCATGGLAVIMTEAVKGSFTPTTLMVSSWSVV